MKVKFIDVGRNNKNWEAETDNVDYDWLYAQVKKHGMVMSSNLNFSDQGTIFAGFQNIGKFEILEDTPQ